MNIGIIVIEDKGFFFVERLGAKLKSLADSCQQVVGVLIFAPDKAMFMYIMYVY